LLIRFSTKQWLGPEFEGVEDGGGFRCLRKTEISPAKKKKNVIDLLVNKLSIFRLSSYHKEIPSGGGREDRKSEKPE